MKLAQAGLLPTSPCNPVAAQEGLWALLAHAGGKGAALRSRSAYFRVVKQGIKVASWDAGPGESLSALPDVHASGHGFLLHLKLLARRHILLITLAP